MRNKQGEAEKVLEMLYDLEGSKGVVRGRRNIKVPREVMRLAIEEYLVSGIDVLDEYDMLLEIINPYFKSQFMTHEEMELLDEALKGETFWDVHKMVSYEQLCVAVSKYRKSEKEYEKGSIT